LRHTFGGKLAAAFALVALADSVFMPDALPGAVAGVFALTWATALFAFNPAVRRDRRAFSALAVAASLGLLLVEAPGLLVIALFLAALASAALLPRSGPFDDAWRWGGRLLRSAAGGLARPLRDARKLARLLPAIPPGRPQRLAAALALPVLGGGVFLALFAAANPVISQVLSEIRPPSLSATMLVRLGFWALVLGAVWTVLRPRLPKRASHARRPRPAAALPGVTPGSTLLSLAVFNAVFALQNGLDATYLWGDAGLPNGMTLAQYAHRGAYPLILTALLAGLFVLVVLKPDSETARHLIIRRLVIFWIGQNVFLVASTMLRTLAYVDAYSLTRLRLAALVWMGLVAVGLVLICWRLLRSKSSAWLINANALAVAGVLVGASVVDFGAVAAAWNVRHAAELGGGGTALDLRYLDTLKASSLVSLAELEQRNPPETLRVRAAEVRARNERELARAQADWRRWSWRGERRLARLRALRSASAVDLAADAPDGLTRPVHATGDLAGGRPIVLTAAPATGR
jgi:hypothetical protein